LFVYYHDETGAESFRFCADGFLCGRNKWRNKHAMIGSRVQPLGLQPMVFLCGVVPMHQHLLFEGILQQLEIAIGMIALASDFERVDASEMFRVSLPYGQSPRVVADILV